MRLIDGLGLDHIVDHWISAYQVIIGGIAAIASAASKDRDHYRDGRFYRDGQRLLNGNDYRRTAHATRGKLRPVVERCASAGHTVASRYGFASHTPPTMPRI